MADNLEQVRQQSQTASQRALQLSSFEPTVSDIIKQRALDAFNANQDLVAPLDTATGEFINAPKVARERYQDVFNPFTREKLVSQFQTQQAVPVQALSSILGQRFGRIEDIIGAGTRAYQSQSQAATGAATLARQNLQDLLAERESQQNLALKLAQMAQEKELKERELSLKGGEGGLTFANRLALFNALKPAATQEKAAQDAQSALGSISAVRSIVEKDPGALKFAGSPILAPLSGNASTLRKHLLTVQDIITRYRTGAALNKQEQAFYEEYVVNPYEAVFNPKRSIETSLGILEDIFKKIESRGALPLELLLGDMPSTQSKSDEAGFVPD